MEVRRDVEQTEEIDLIRKIKTSPADYAMSTKLPEIKTEKKRNSHVPQATTTTAFSFEEPTKRRSSHDENKRRQQQQKQQDQQLPHIILNDKRRSTSYRRLAKSEDFDKVKSSPLATRFVYNWQPLERATTRVVQAKVKVYKPPKRIESTGRPPSPYRLCVDYETKDPHAHNHERTMAMKRLQYLREHTEWSIYPYAGIEEREEYNKRLRDTLKDQISQKDQLLKKLFETKSLEYKYFMEQDRMALEVEKKKRAEKFEFMKTYRDENKQMMEDKWMQEYLLKRHEWQQENNLLKLDPINWSKTLR